ncbi:HIRAN domain-containing protein [Pseudomonas sp. HLG18]|uniref:HIRAN domain-containing protein n=1 Tax=Pseudomonas sp. HLG18 TaxID=3449277 RepID=UPI003F748791
MHTIDHVFEPTRLFLVWTSTTEGVARNRRIVGELVKKNDHCTFRYLKDTPDYHAAVNEGFIGFPAFTINGNEEFDNALAAFMSRIPPRKRQDFPKYLAQYGLPSSFNGSDFSLLGYTGARLASDSFELSPDLSTASAPIDVVLEVSGTQYNKVLGDITEGMLVTFVHEPENQHDKNAIAIMTSFGRIGYVSRALNKGFSHLLSQSRVTGTVLSSDLRKEKIKILILAEFK